MVTALMELVDAWLVTAVLIAQLGRVPMSALVMVLATSFCVNAMRDLPDLIVP
jgi:hypothetical protein